VFYESKDGELSLQVQLENESVWLSQKQMAELFDTSVPNINQHIKSIFEEEELIENSVVKDFLITASDGKNYKTKSYNLDAILSIGYKIKSKRATQFRQWASKVLKAYLIEGYALNESVLKKQNKKIKQLESTLSIMSDLMKSTDLGADESQGLLVVIREYTHALNLLDCYDHQALELPQTQHNIKFDITYTEARSAVDQLSSQFRAQGENMGLLNDLLYSKNGAKRIEDNALVAICLMVAQSNPKEKDIMTLLIVNLITKNKQS
jgi:hypothetical protein